ncbi:MAG: hypothetical protein LBV74_05695 [Tannerella sp.]|jgi:hypothetical protein|nr:hypothetical protein [Tannerella sp.]
MNAISSTELRNNVEKYLDRAKSETVVIRRGQSETFILTRQDDLPDDFYRAISIDESIGIVETGIRKNIKKQKAPQSNESGYIAGSSRLFFAILQV